MTFHALTHGRATSLLICHYYYYQEKKSKWKGKCEKVREVEMEEIHFFWATAVRFRGCNNDGEGRILGRNSSKVKVKLVMVVPLKLERVVACIEYTMKDKRKKSKEMPTRIAYIHTYIYVWSTYHHYDLGKHCTLSFNPYLSPHVPPSLIFNNIRFCRCC